MLGRKAVVAGMVLMLALVACTARAAEPEASPVDVSHGKEIGGYVELVDALRAAVGTVEPVGDVEQPFFSVGGQVIQVNGADVQVFEYADEASRQADTAQIGPDGSTVGTSMITWVDQPHFWAKGRVIVLYVGQDQATLDLLGSVLGEPVAAASN